MSETKGLSELSPLTPVVQRQTPGALTLEGFTDAYRRGNVRQMNYYFNNQGDYWTTIFDEMFQRQINNHNLPQKSINLLSARLSFPLGNLFNDLSFHDKEYFLSRLKRGSRVYKMLVGRKDFRTHIVDAFEINISPVIFQMMYDMCYQGNIMYIIVNQFITMISNSNGSHDTSKRINFLKCVEILTASGGFEISASQIKQLEVKLTELYNADPSQRNNPKSLVKACLLLINYNRRVESLIHSRVGAPFDVNRIIHGYTTIR